MSDESALRRVRPLWLVVPAAALLMVAWASTFLVDWAMLVVWLIWAVLALVCVASAFGLLRVRRRR